MLEEGTDDVIELHGKKTKEQPVEPVLHVLFVCVCKGSRIVIQT